MTEDDDKFEVALDCTGYRPGTLVQINETDKFSFSLCRGAESEHLARPGHRGGGEARGETTTGR